MESATYIFVIFVAFAGFLLSSNIYRKKREAKPMVCPLNSDCNAVIHSQFSTFLEIPLEILGMAYYALIAISYGIFLAFPATISPLIIFLLLSVTTFAFLFSLYLTFIQAFAIKEWCVWCLTSASFCTAIFLTVVFGTNQSLASLLSAHSQIILTAGMGALALGVGSATIYNLLFIKFLRDFKISQTENDVLKTISQTIWFSIFLLILSGIGIFPQIYEFTNTKQLAVSLTILLVIILNEVMINIFLAPKLVEISLGEKHPHHEGELHQLRKLSFVISSVSFLSWYSLLAVLLLSNQSSFSFSLLLLSYIAIVIAGFMIGLFMDYQSRKV